jgi:hypothetical protein
LLQPVLRFIALILLAIFVLLFPLSLALRDVGALVFDPETTKALVRQHLIDSRLIASLAEQATQELLLPGGSSSGSASVPLIGSALSSLSEADWEEITDLTAPTALVEQTVDEVVTAYTDWLDGDQPLPQITLDLSRWKVNTQANAGQVMAVVLDALPACAAADVAGMALDALQSVEGMLANMRACRPPEPFYSALINNAGLLFSASLQAAPDSIDLSQLGQGSQAPQELLEIKQNLVQVRQILSWGWAAVAAIGFAGILLAARGLIPALRWAGWPLLITGAATLIFGLGLQFFSLHFLDNLLAGPLMEEAGAVGALGRAIAGGALDLVSKPLLLQGLLLTALGTAGVYVSSVLARQQASPGIPLNQRRIGL